MYHLNFFFWATTKICNFLSCAVGPKNSQFDLKLRFISYEKQYPLNAPSDIPDTRTLWRKLSITFWQKSEFISPMTRRISCFNWGTVLGSLAKTRDFTKPHRKKSHGDKSHDRGGQWRSPLFEIRRPGNFCWSNWLSHELCDKLLHLAETRNQQHPNHPLRAKGTETVLPLAR